MKLLAKIITIGTLLQSTYALANPVNFQIQCADDVSGDTILIQYSANRSQGQKFALSFHGPQTTARIYFGENLKVGTTDYELFLVAVDPQSGYQLEEVTINSEVFTEGRGWGSYSDQGDSRAIQCVKVQ
jgi:hypothetical protein